MHPQSLNSLVLLFCVVNIHGIIVLKEQRKRFRFQYWNVTKCVQTLYVVKMGFAGSRGTDRNFSNLEMHYSCVILEACRDLYSWSNVFCFQMVLWGSHHRYDLVTVVQSDVTTICSAVMEFELCTFTFT